jgi:hypothetical protein
MPTWLSTNYNKGVLVGLTLLIDVGNQLLGTDLGISPVGQHWVSVVVGAAGTALTILTGNKNQPTLAQGQVVVNRADVKEGAPIVVAHKP